MLTVISKEPPAAPMLTLDETKAHLRVDHDEEDELIEGMIAAAQAYLEGPFGVLGRTIMKQTWTGSLSIWPAQAYVEIPLPPLVSVTEARLVASDGSTTIWPPESYRIMPAAEHPARLWSVDSWPSKDGNGLAFDFEAGYEELPPNLRLAALMIVADFYDNRAAVADRESYKNPTVQRMLEPFKVWYV